MAAVLSVDDWQKALPNVTFANYLRRARERFERGEATTVAELRQVYRRAAQKVRRDLRDLAPGTLRQRHLAALERLLAERERELNEQVLSAIQRGIRFAVREAVSGPEQLTQDLLGDVLQAAGVRALFANVNERAVAAVLARTGRDGLRLSGRVWKAGGSYRQTIRRLVEDAVARGEDSRTLAKRIEGALLPTARRPLRPQTARRLGVPRDVTHAGMRLAVTEMQHAYHEASLLANRVTPSYRGGFWRLSNSHPLPDICDEYARRGGDGFWEKGHEPTKPHPWCRCVLVPAHEAPDEFRARLEEWLSEPGRQPALEAWYQEVRPFVGQLRAAERVPEQPQFPGGLPFNPRALRPITMPLEGAHAKQVYEGPDGALWLFKPDETPAQAEKAGYEVMRALGLDAPDVYILELDGRKGSLQRMWADVVAPIRVDGLAGLPAEQIAQIQRHQVVDWLISQHDTNDGALLLSDKGVVYAVDKGQAFKFLGRDRLDWTYNPNPNRLVYNQLFEDYIAGRLDLRREVIEDLLTRVEQLDEAVLQDLIRPYAEHAAAMGFVRSPEEVLARIVERKRTIRQAFATLYDRAEAARAQRFPPPAAPFTKIDRAFAEDVHRQGWAGRSIMVAGPEIEGGNLLVYELQHGAERILVLEGKLRPLAEQLLLSRLGVVSTSAAGILPGDSYWPQLLAVIKHVNYHLKPSSPGFDGLLSAEKVGLLKTTAAALARATGDFAPTKAAGKHYAKIISELTGGRSLAEVAEATNDELVAWLREAYQPKEFTQYLRPARAQETAPDQLAAVAGRPWQLSRTMRNGMIETDSRRQEVEGEKAYTISLGPTIEAVYLPHLEGNAYSKAGRFQIYRRQYQGTPEEIRDTVAQLQRLGLPAKLATREDLELLYLHKVAFAAKVDQSPAYQRAVLDRLQPDTPAREQIAIMKAYWNERLGVRDVSKLPTYQPEPQFDRGWNPSEGGRLGPAGWAHWVRFDVTPEDLEREMEEYGLIHRLSLRNANSVAEVLEQMLSGSGRLLPTEERIRAGLFRGEGMSPVADQTTGGASYAFTRIAKRFRWGEAHLVFDKKLLLRTDNLSYDSDKYGNARPFYQATRAADIRGWIQNGYRDANETTIKNGMGLLDHVVSIQSQGQRRAVLAVLRKHGVTELAGRPIEEVVE